VSVPKFFCFFVWCFLLVGGATADQTFDVVVPVVSALFVCKNRWMKCMKHVKKDIEITSSLLNSSFGVCC